MIFPKFLNFIKEPVVQFTILGALLFAIDHVLVINRDDPRNVLIDDNQIEQFISVFEEGQGRAPSGREINNMVVAWAQNEILYREARRMGLDRGDDMIRNRLILKIRNVLFNNVVIDQPSEEQLQEFFDFNQTAYYIPERYDLEMIALPSHYDLPAAQSLTEQASREGMPEAYLGNRFRYENRRKENLAAMFGSQESATLLSSKSEQGSWSLISNPQGHHLVRITNIREAVVPSLNSVRSRVVQDWERYIGDTQISDQTYSIARQYQVRLEVSDAFLEKMESDLPRNPFQDAPALSGKPENTRNLSSQLAADGR